MWCPEYVCGNVCIASLNIPPTSPHLPFPLSLSLPCLLLLLLLHLQEMQTGLTMLCGGQTTGSGSTNLDSLSTPMGSCLTPSWSSVQFTVTSQWNCPTDIATRSVCLSVLSVCLSVCLSVSVFLSLSLADYASITLCSSKHVLFVLSNVLGVWSYAPSAKAAI